MEKMSASQKEHKAYNDAAFQNRVFTEVNNG